MLSKKVKKQLKSKLETIEVLITLDDEICKRAYGLPQETCIYNSFREIHKFIVDTK